MTAAETPQLSLFTDKRPTPSESDAQWLIDFLNQHRGWVKAKTIQAMLGGRHDDRGIRAIAELAAPKIISGQNGYKHTDHATAEEIKMFINTMESQGTKMLNRANKVRTYAHAKIG